MDMEVTAWNVAVHHDDRAGRTATHLPKATLAPDRGVRPAASHASSAGSSLLSVVTAVLAVATPLLAGRVVDAIVGGRNRRWW